MNKMILTGRVGVSPELAMVGADKKTPRVRFTVAVNEYFKKGEERVKVTTWVPVVAWGPITTALLEIVTTGSLLLVEGKLRTFSYTDKKDKVERSGFEMRLERWELLKKPADRAADDSQDSPDDDGADASGSEDDEILF